jgi:rubredoxin
MTPTCLVCGHQHDPELEGVWEELPQDFQCPECGAFKQDYQDF